MQVFHLSGDINYSIIFNVLFSLHSLFLLVSFFALASPLSFILGVCFLDLWKLFIVFFIFKSTRGANGLIGISPHFLSSVNHWRAFSVPIVSIWVFFSFSSFFLFFRSTGWSQSLEKTHSSLSRKIKSCILEANRRRN